MNPALKFLAYSAIVLGDIFVALVLCRIFLIILVEAAVKMITHYFIEYENFLKRVSSGPAEKVLSRFDVH